MIENLLSNDLRTLDVPPRAHPLRDKTPAWFVAALSTLLFVTTTLGMISLSLWIYLGAIVASMITAAGTAALIVWVRTSWRQPFHHSKIFAPFVATLTSGDSAMAHK